MSVDIDEEFLKERPCLIEDVEKASTRMICRALFDCARAAQEIFRRAGDMAGTVGEDITRQAIDEMGLSRVPGVRLIGKIDYKRAVYIFHPAYEIRQALFVDSKAEKGEDRTVTIQKSQTSMDIKFRRKNTNIDVPGELPHLFTYNGQNYLTTTVFVKYLYKVSKQEESNSTELTKIIVICLPNGMLQARYNPTFRKTIWRAGRDSPKRKEKFRARIDLGRLAHRAKWRIQEIDVSRSDFTWNE